MRLSKATWDEIKALYCSGTKSNELSERFGVTEASIRKRSERQRWPTAANMRKKQEELSAPKPSSPRQLTVHEKERNANDDLLRTLLARRLEQQEGMYHVLRDIMKRVRVDEIPIETIKDLKTLMDMMRDNVGLNEDKNGGTIGAAAPLVNVSILGGGTSVRDATIDI